jgi:hypothetical protein
MKIRNGFVSNSSSSSFVVALSVLSEEEKQKILGYVPFSNADEYKDHWSIRIDEIRGVIYGFTTMDNGDLSKYLGEELNGKFIFEGE